MKIAVISDLHIGRDARSSDLCPHILETKVQIAKERSFLIHLKKHINNLNLTADCLCITGDISNEAHPAEFRMAGIIISEIAVALAVPESRIFFVPGNHDVNWPVQALDTEADGFWLDQRYRPMLEATDFFTNRLRHAQVETLFNAPYIAVWSEENFEVVAINTAGHDGPRAGTHHGLVNQSAIDCLDDFFTTSGINNNDQTRVCLIHHHPLNYSDLICHEPDFSVATNAENLLKALTKHRFDFLIHGHKHVPKITTWRNGGGHPLVVLAAGSLSCKLDSKHTGIIGNQFHIIESNVRDTDTEVINGEIKTWVYEHEGRWGTGKRLVGLGHRHAFGATPEPKILRTIMLKCINIALDKKSAARWTEVSQLNNTLKYSDPEALYLAAKALEAENNFSLLGDIDVDLDIWTVFRKD